MTLYYLKTESVRRALEQRHWSSGQVANQLRLSRGYWNALLAGRAHVSAAVRRKILASEAFGGIRQGWEVRPPQDYETDSDLEVTDAAAWATGFAEGVCAYWSRVERQLA